MCWKEDKPLMVEAYSMLYDIEMAIVHHIVECFKKHYNSKWKIYINQYYEFDTAYFRQLIKYFKKYPHVFPHIKDSHIEKLYELKEIRNKICHMHPLTQDEFKMLKRCCRLIHKLTCQ